MDLIITDHHQPVESLPDAIAVINPQVSPNYPFKGLAGV
jgi:single-stranded-DNA-specific exonuclease